MKELLPEVSYIAIDTQSTTVGKASNVESPSEMHITSLSGVLSDSKRNWSLDHSIAIPSACTVFDIADSPGEWSALATTQKARFRKFLYFGDPSGFAPVFYSLIPGRALVISDTFSGIVQGVQRLGGNLSLNVEHYLTLISGKSTTFQNLISDQTMATEVRLLRYDKAITVDHERVDVFDRRILSRAQQFSDYENALDQSIEATATAIESLAEASTETTRAITLTGGADSRMVFAILVASGLEKKFNLWTIDPRVRKSPQQQQVFTADVEIANELRSYYGLRWMKPLPREKISVSFEEALAHHQSYNSNFAFTYKPSKALAFNSEALLSLRGGGGEILRGSGGARIAESRYEKYLENGGTQKESTWLAGEYTRGSFMTSATQPIVKTYLERTLDGYEAETLRETVDAFYRNTRNRGHFGHARKSMRGNDQIMLPLTNPHLLRAMELIDYPQKISGKLVIDLLDKTEPRLRDFPFENASTNRQLNNAPQHAFKFRNRDGWQKAFDSNDSLTAPTDFRPLWEPGTRGEISDSSISAKDFDFVSVGFDRLLDIVPNELRQLVSEQHKVSLGNYSDGIVPVGTMSAKVASALDVFAPMPLDRPGTHFFTGPVGSHRIPPSNDLANRASTYDFRLP